MPDRTGYFSDAEQEKIKSWVNDHTQGGFCCHACGNAEMSVFSHLVGAPTTSRVKTNVESVFEVVGVGCSKCGIISWYNADIIGVGTDAPTWNPETDSEEAQNSVARESGRSS